jgi:putative ubiquitin-RnfH superfamily antitoxin RatB of RatAB toxin-antitoxin module
VLVEMVCALPQGLERASLELAPGSTVRDALRASGFSARLAQHESARVGIWGRPVSPDTELRDRDRVEIYRRLIADPKEVRRVRAAKAGK